MHKGSIWLDDEDKELEIQFDTIEFKRTLPVFGNFPNEIVQENRRGNIKILADGVANSMCLYAGGASFNVPVGVSFTMPDDCLDYYVSSAEVYSNNAINIYCRSKKDKRLLGYILIR